MALALSISANSKFDMSLLQEHLMQANLYFAACQAADKPLLDVCGERGDLYFLLHACLRQQGGGKSCAQTSPAWRHE